MTLTYHASALRTAQIPQVLPLIKATWPGVDLDTWRRFAKFFVHGRGGDLAGARILQDSADCICGIFVYRLERDLQHGLVLAVPLFSAVDVANSPNTTRALLEACLTQAGSLECETLHVHLYEQQSGLASRLKKLGLAQERNMLTMPVTEEWRA